MPNIRIRGRVINKITRQPVTGVVVTLRKASSSPVSIAVDVDGEFDENVSVYSGSDKYEMKIDKDAGYRYKIVSFTFGSTSALSKDFGDIELEPYTD